LLTATSRCIADNIQAGVPDRQSQIEGAVLKAVDSVDVESWMYESKDIVDYLESRFAGDLGGVPRQTSLGVKT